MHQILDITLNNMHRYTIAAFDACIQCILTHRYVLRYEILINAFNTACLEEETAKRRITEEEAKGGEEEFAKGRRDEGVR